MLQAEDKHIYCESLGVKSQYMFSLQCLSQILDLGQEEFMQQLHQAGLA